MSNLKIAYKKPQDKIELMKDSFIENFYKRQDKKMEKFYEHTETKHMIEEPMTRERAFEIFRMNYTSIKVFQHDGCLVYGPFHKKFGQSTLETATALIKRKNLPLKARLSYFITEVELIIEEI